MSELTGIRVKAEESDLLTLTGSDREAAMQGLTAGDELPFVIVSGTLACCGGFEMEEIAEAVRHAALP